MQPEEYKISLVEQGENFASMEIGFLCREAVLQHLASDFAQGSIEIWEEDFWLVGSVDTRFAQFWTIFAIDNLFFLSELRLSSRF